MTAWPSTASTRQSVAAAIAGHSGRDCCRMRRTPAARFVCVVSLGGSRSGAARSPLVPCSGEGVASGIVALQSAAALLAIR